MRMRKKVFGFVLNESRTPPPPTNFVRHTLYHHSRTCSDTLIEATNFSVLTLNILFIDSRSNPHKSNTSQTLKVLLHLKRLLLKEMKSVNVDIRH